MNKEKLDNCINIGRGKDNNIIISEVFISDKHCTIKRINEEEYVIEDLNSKSGVYVDGRRVLRKKINNDSSVSLGHLLIDTGLILNYFKYNSFLNPIKYEDYIKQENAIREFEALRKVYDDYLELKKKIIKKNVLKSTAIRASLSMIPIIGAPLSILSSGMGETIQEKLLEIEEEFKKKYVCPSCYKFLAEPYENIKKRGECIYCKIKFIRD